ncbi:ATP-dependent DNA ligase [Sphaerisporangium flaviroseum]|uniref:ATP-dependent DNA ligase n=1 Tax=Sphaerisporangium flaviroseum TaxID=509199 RepID=UPI0031F17C47
MVEPMLARVVDHLPRGPAGRYFYEPKWDGFRTIAVVDDNGEVYLRSRRGAHFNHIFPEVVQAVQEYLPPATVVDGEIVRWAPEGRLDFAAVQRRSIAGRRSAELARTEPCHYIVFDVLEAWGKELRSAPLRVRRQALEELFTPVPPAATLTLSMLTTDVDEAFTWFRILTAAGVEGVMIKPAGEPYRPGARGWMKYKARTTTEAIVGGVTGTLSRPVTLVLGRYTAGGHLRVAGRSTPLRSHAAEQLAPLLTPAGHEHPWPDRLPSGWVGLHGKHEAVDYIRVRPDLVVEIEVDVAAEHGRWRHPVRYLRPRPDLPVNDVPLGLDLDGG